MDSLKQEVKPKEWLIPFLATLERSPLFETLNLKKWEVLFDEGEINNRIYIIKNGFLSVQKFTSTDRTSLKQLALLKAGDFIGEWWLSWVPTPKEARILAVEDTTLLSIDATIDLKKFLEENPYLGYEVMKQIIVETNQRLLEANKLIASNYEIERQIMRLKKIDAKWVFHLLENMCGVVDVDYILYFEKHAVLDNFLILKYDSRTPNKMLDLVFERSGYFLDLDELYIQANIKPEDRVIINKLNLGEEVFGFLVFGRESRGFTGSDKKIFLSTSHSLAGIIKKLFADREDKDRIYVNEMKSII